MLKTKLCGKTLKSPLILGSGALGESKDTLIKALQKGAGAVVTRTLRLDNTKRIPIKPSYYHNSAYMLNADNNNKTPWTYWVEHAKEIEQHGPLVISISARAPDDCKAIVSEFEKNYPPSFYELNFSCSHSAKLYGMISYRNAMFALNKIKALTNVPVFLKLSLDNLNVELLNEIEALGLADALVVSNTIGPGLKIDIKTRRSVLGSVYGGVSGAAIKPLVMAKIHELKKHIKLPIIGVGGIMTAEDVLEYIMLGCDAVQIYTAAHTKGLDVFNDINFNLGHFLADTHETIETIKNTFICDGV